ncbi:family 16 glycosylhydrolase [Adhaeretor mobilis]|uniref:Beta-porphyranase A n=1 Tax=Adhaeretor mobilis TaxID=1930276 RepID=A0A517MUD9_9BACT|nr:family 16 glycosylhydrolase [Adhaeretor mobilis]QDS98494.1 Beta-porphyranase A precursor [Adhaeretor mobilis]
MRISNKRGLRLLTVLGLLTATLPVLKADDLPLSDQENQGNWTLNPEVSDEFDAAEIDDDKWFIQGTDGDYYIWKGRPPSQYAAHNVYVEDGHLKIRSQWEPKFSFYKGAYADGDRNDSYGMWEGKPMPITTGGIISKQRFLNGYMEVRTKAGNSNMICAFWALGYESEVDIYEQIGPAKIKGDIQPDTWKASVHNWSPPAKRPTRRFGLKTKLPFRVADEFHVYGCEWGEDYLKLFLDGKLYYETTQEKEGENWVLTNPLELYFDSEIFVWLGLPNKEELPSYYEIDYVRVWQKPQDNLLARQFFGFEGPILYDDHPIPLTLVPESSEVNEYQKFWQIGEHGLPHFSYSKEQAAKGIKSLKFTPKGVLGNVAIVSPAGAVDIQAGEYQLSLQVFVTEDCDVEALNVSLADPEILFETFDLTKVEKGTWITLKEDFKRDSSSGEGDRLRLRFLKAQIPEGTGALYIDNIAIGNK